MNFNKMYGLFLRHFYLIKSSFPRVLNFVSLSDNFKTAKEKIKNNLEKLNWSGGFYRKDIGYKVIKS